MLCNLQFSVYMHEIKKIEGANSTMMYSKARYNNQNNLEHKSSYVSCRLIRKWKSRA